MNEQNQLDFASHMRRLDWVVRLGIALILFGFGIGGWVMRLELRSGDLTASANKHESELTALAIWKAAADANRFTVQDFQRSSQIILDGVNGNDKRITRLEDGMARIEKLMERIESRLQPK